jgi:hypothetical protein
MIISHKPRRNETVIKKKTNSKWLAVVLDYMANIIEASL